MKARRRLALSLLVSGGLAKIPAGQASAFTRRKVIISSVATLHAALDEANRSGGHVDLLLEDGHYAIRRTLNVLASGISLASVSGQRDRVVLKGDAMSASAAIGNVIRVAGSDFHLKGVTVELCRNHAVQIAGEAGAHRPNLTNCVFRDCFEQLVKISGSTAGSLAPCLDGLVQDCLFEYTAGIGPQYYIGGVDGHGCRNWIVRRNVFRAIASPSHHVAEQAVHFWGVENILVEDNYIVNCDRGIQFGLGRDRSVRGGVIRNNVVFHEDNGHPFADVGISLESSPDVEISGNTVVQRHPYPNAIEIRFPGTQGGVVTGNIVNKAIRMRDGGTARIDRNIML
jgi:hypothetical protein